MSVDGFNRLYRPRGIKQNGDFIVVHYDPKETDLNDVIRFMECIEHLPERNRGTVFAIEPQGMWFRRV